MNRTNILSSILCYQFYCKTIFVYHGDCMQVDFSTFITMQSLRDTLTSACNRTSIIIYTIVYFKPVNTKNPIYIYKTPGIK